MAPVPAVGHRQMCSDVGGTTAIKQQKIISIVDLSFRDVTTYIQNRVTFIGLYEFKRKTYLYILRKIQPVLYEYVVLRQKKPIGAKRPGTKSFLSVR